MGTKLTRYNKKSNLVKSRISNGRQTIFVEIRVIIDKIAY